MRYPNLNEEKKLWRRGYKNVICIDEAGCGPLAGPVVAAAVMIQDKKYKIKNTKVRDSKKLSAKQRGELYKILTRHPAIKWGIGIVSERIIDKINIKNASELAMEKAIDNLKHRYQKLNIKQGYLIIDGNRIKSKKLKAKSYKLIIKADEKVLSCSMASIIAKVTRDRIMIRYHRKYPKYRFDLHKGYPVKKHFSMLKKYGPCRIHRKSFLPVISCQKI